MDIQYAHEILSDEDKRQIYDIDGEEGLKRAQQGGGGGGGGIFDMFGFGGGGGGGKRKGPDYRMNYEVTLEDLYNGLSREVRIQRNVLCKTCRGTGAKDGKTKPCPHCGGKGSVTQLQQIMPGFNMQVQQQCDKCGGKGKLPHSHCPICGGRKVKMEEKTLDLVVERGMREGQEIVFERASEQSPDTTPGDVILTLKPRPHSRFHRDGDDLRMNFTITLKEALLGFKKHFLHLDHEPRRVILEETGVTQPEFTRKLIGEGMPHHETPSLRGNLYVTYTSEPTFFRA